MWNTKFAKLADCRNGKLEAAIAVALVFGAGATFASWPGKDRFLAPQSQGRGAKGASSDAVSLDQSAYPLRLVLPTPSAYGPSGSMQSGTLASPATEAGSESSDPTGSADEAASGQGDEIGALLLAMEAERERSSPGERRTDGPVKERTNLLGLNYSIDAIGSPRTREGEKKRFYVNGSDYGALDIFPSDDGGVFIIATDFREIVESRHIDIESNKIPSRNHISLQEIRSLGVDVRYDPIKDRVIISNQ